ncbi:MAG: TolC family protein [Myxococcaceae bacterium]
MTRSALAATYLRPGHRRRGRGLSLKAVLMAAVAFAGCAGLQPGRFVNESAGPAPSAPLRPKEPPPSAAPDVPALPPAGQPAPLSALLDLALRNSPLTRAAWYDARAAAAQVGSRSSAYYPTLELSAQVQALHQTSLVTGAVLESVNVGPAASLSYLLLDLGGRAAGVEEARQQLAFANLTHAAAVQDLIFRVEQAYYGLLALKALRGASAANLQEAQIALEAATERQKSGVATLAEVLQAKTSASQARLTERTTEGLVQIARGNLAAALGLPATVEISVGELPGSVEVHSLGKSVDALVEEALRQRPDLAATRALVPRAQARVRSAWSAALPSLFLAGTASRPYVLNPGTGVPYGENYLAQLTLSVPVFNGFRDSYDIAQAEEAVEAAKARAEATGQQVALQVWTSYQNVTTAAQKVTAARDLLESALASADVATGRYEAGAGTFIDLLTAQAALAAARAQDVESRADYLVSLAALARDTGALRPPPAGDAKP